MAKKFTFDDAITTDIKGAASNSYIDNIKMIKIADIETNAENFYRCLTKQYRTNYHTSRFPTGTRKSILFTILCALFISPNRKKYREHKSYRLSNRTTANTNIIRTKYCCENIRYGDLISAQGNNFAVKIRQISLEKLLFFRFSTAQM